MNTRWAHDHGFAHTKHDYAQMLLARDGTGDRERAQELLDAALATYWELDMAGRCSDLGARAGDRHRRFHAPSRAQEGSWRRRG